MSIEKITEAREDMGGVVEFVGCARLAAYHPAAILIKRFIGCIGDKVARTQSGTPFPADCNDEYRGNRESSHLSWCPTMARALGASTRWSAALAMDWSIQTIPLL